MSIRLYEFVSKTDVDLVVDLAASSGICCNTLLNSIILLKFDGLVQSSAIELLGLEEWWTRSAKKLPNRNTRVENIILVNKNDAFSLTTTVDAARGHVGPMNSLATQRITS